MFVVFLNQLVRYNQSSLRLQTFATIQSRRTLMPLRKYETCKLSDGVRCLNLKPRSMGGLNREWPVHI